MILTLAHLAVLELQGVYFFGWWRFKLKVPSFAFLFMKLAAYEENHHTNKHQGLKCERSEDSGGWKESRERKHSWPYVCSGSVLLAASACTITSSLSTPSSPPPSYCCITAASHQNEPPPHISAQVWSHSWVLDTDLTRGPALGDLRLMDGAPTELRSSQTEQIVLLRNVSGHEKLFLMSQLAW